MAYIQPENNTEHLHRSAHPEIIYFDYLYEIVCTVTKYPKTIVFDLDILFSADSGLFVNVYQSQVFYIFSKKEFGNQRLRVHYLSTLYLQPICTSYFSDCSSVNES